MYLRLLPACICIAALCACQPNTNPPPSPDGPERPVAAKPVIYQAFVRLFGNMETANKPYGTLHENGCGKFGSFSDRALDGIQELGVTHVWYTGVLEHATMTAFPDAHIPADDADVVKGRAGSPYAIKDYYDVAPALADNPANRMAEFQQLLQRTHAHGLKAIIDFVPNHVARNYRSDARPDHVADLGETDDPGQTFSPTNNFYYLPGKSFQVPQDYNPLGPEKAPEEDGRFAESPARATGNNVFSPSPQGWDWFETIKLNYGVDMGTPTPVNHFTPVPETWTKMRDILLFWAGKGVDGFRCDMAEMVPVEFWAWAIPEVKQKHPEVIFIAEIYNPAQYKTYVAQGKFDYLYDKVGTYDAVRALMTNQGGAGRLDSVLGQTVGLEGHMLRFLENHDEQRIASKDFAGTPWAAVPGMAVSATLGPEAILLYFGQEVGEPGMGAEGFQGEDGRTTIFDYWGVPEHQKWMNGGKFDGGGLDSSQKALRSFYATLMKICKTHPALAEGQRVALPAPDPRAQVYAFLRYHGDERILVVANFDATQSWMTMLRIPQEAWKQVGLSPVGPYLLKDLLGSGREERITAEETLGQGQPLNLAPHSAYIFSLQPL